MSKIAAINSPLINTSGGDDRARTGDPRLAKPMLSQLSYIPMKSHGPAASVVGLTRFELVTSRLSGVRSNQTELQAHTLNPVSRLFYVLERKKKQHPTRTRAQPCIGKVCLLPLYTP